MSKRFKFDVFLGNPPFQNSNREAKSGKLWPKFIELGLRSLAEGGHMLMISPNSWTKGNIAPNGSGKLYKTLAARDMRYLNNTDCGSHFPGVGVLFSWFHIINQPNTGQGILEQGSKTLLLDFASMDFIPNDVNGISIAKKFFNGDREVIKHTLVTNTRNNKMVFSDSGNRVVFTNGKFCRTDSTEFDDDEKILVPWSNTYDKHVTWGRYVAGDSCVYAYTNGNGANWFTVFTSKLYRYCLGITRMAQHNEGVRSFPAVDFTRSWTDQGLYDHFALTPEEQSYVESIVVSYAG